MVPTRLLQSQHDGMPSHERRYCELVCPDAEESSLLPRQICQYHGPPNLEDSAAIRVLCRAKEKQVVVDRFAVTDPKNDTPFLMCHAETHQTRVVPALKEARHCHYGIDTVADSASMIRGRL